MAKISYKKKLKAITTFIFDIDGVITDGKLIMHPSGEFLRNMSVKDGYALRRAIDAGYQVFIISGGESESMRKRLAYLGIKEIYMGSSNKIKSYKEIKEKYNLKNKEVVYMGDDIPDCELLATVGVSVAPKDAVFEVKEIVDYISHYRGGRGAVRDIIEQVMKIHKKWTLPSNLQAN